MFDPEGVDEAIILVKATPQVGRMHGETVCCAGVTLAGEWLRLYPVTFRRLDDAKKFGRWDHIRFRWRKPKDDSRPESRRLDQQSIEILGKLPAQERGKLLATLEVTGLNAALAQGKSLALLRPQNPRLIIHPKSPEEFAQEKNDYEGICGQGDFFYQKELLPLEPCPFKFKYQYTTDDGDREGTCQDWETDATYFSWSKRYGDRKALEHMQHQFGVVYPQKGMMFAMGTHSRYPDRWLINGIIRMDEFTQIPLF